MKEVLYFHSKACMYCKYADKVMAEVKKEPKYANVELTVVEERKNKKLANSYDYKFVPAIFVDGVKVYEAQIGYIFQPEDCRKIFDLILE